jgi:hypothetical protein
MSDLRIFNSEDPAETKRRLDEFVARCGLVIQHVLRRNFDERRIFANWLSGLIAESENPFWILHEDPLYLTAEYFGIDAASVETGQLANDYLRLARRQGWVP